MRILTTKNLNVISQFIRAFTMASCFLLFLTQPSAAQNSRWFYVGTSSDGINFYIDKTSIEQSGGEVRLWEKSVFRDGSYQINQSRWQCAEKATAVIVSNIYTPQGNFVERKFGKGWNRIIPDSIGEGIYRTVCVADTTKTTVTQPTAENIQVISKLANIREFPSMDAEVVKKASKGTVFRLVSSEPESGWYQIYIGDDETAWIHGNTVEFVFIVPPPENNRNKKKLSPSLLTDAEEGRN